MGQPGVRAIKVWFTLFLFFVACFLACIYAKYEETHHARFTGPAGRAKDRTISPDR